MAEPKVAEVEREFEFTQDDFDFIAKWVNSRTGIVLSQVKRDMVYSRLARRLRVLGLKTFAEYCELVQSDAGEDETGNLVNAITTNLTSFFREKHHFEHLHKTLIELAPSCGGRLRIWSAGCSTGMETYSIAMVLASVVRECKFDDAKILATDIDTNVLNKGREGIYPDTELASIPPSFHRYLEHDAAGETITMGNELKQLISFKQLNLLESWPMKGPFDVIFCRNVVIYFDKQTQRGLFARYAELIKPNGWLYIGHSENLQGVTDCFEPKGRTIYQRIPK